MPSKIVLGWKWSMRLLEIDWCGTSKIWREEKERRKEKLRRGKDKEEKRREEKSSGKDRKVEDKLKVKLISNKSTIIWAGACLVFKS